ncbi:MAG: hypothetical protein Q8N68_03700 [bacterium]|nr:hypothetical protein [bacterium]
MAYNHFNKTKIIIAVSLIIFGTIGRILLKDLPNIETVTVASLLAGSILGGAYAVIIPLTIIALSDMHIGNDPILIFTWSAWAMIGLMARLLYRKQKNTYKFVFQITGLGILASVFFYFWTNFGVWLLWNMYPHNFSGLIQCYAMGLPFLRNNLISDLIFIPAASASLVFCVKYFKNRTYAFRLNE